MAEAGEIGLCGTCQHWSFDERDWQYDAAKMGQCKRIEMREDIVDRIPNRWEMEWEAQNKAEADVLTAAKAIAVDGSGYFACLRTTADFGCVLYTAKPSETLIPPQSRQDTETTK